MKPLITIAVSLAVSLAAGLGAAACAKPEPEPAAVGAAPSVAAPELESEYVDPVEAARAAAQAQDPSDASWREGFDHRASPDPDGEADTANAEPSLDEQPEREGPVEDVKPAVPPNTATPTFSEPLPSLDGAAPRPGAARHPDDAVPPPR